MKTFRKFLEESTRRKGQKYDSRMNFDADLKHPDITIEKPSGVDTHIHHKDSGITYKIAHYDKNYSPDFPNSRMHDNKPTHSISVTHNHETDNLNSSQRRKLTKTAMDIYHTHVAHRIPSGHLISNIPQRNYRIQDGKVKEADTRARMYQRHGFGEVGSGRRTQYSAKIGNKLHPVNNSEVGKIKFNRKKP